MQNTVKDMLLGLPVEGLSLKMLSVPQVSSAKLTSSISVQSLTKNNNNNKKAAMLDYKEAMHQSKDASNFFTFMTIVIIISYNTCIWHKSPSEGRVKADMASSCFRC